MSILGLLPPRTRSMGAEAAASCSAARDLLHAPRRELQRAARRGHLDVFQEPMTSLNPVFTVGDQLAEVLRLHMGLSRAQARARAIELLDEVGIPEPASARRRAIRTQLSGGQQQRVMIAMAIACEPKLLIADEPTTALDVTIQRQILDLLRRSAAAPPDERAVHQPRSGRGRRDRRPRGRDARGRDPRERAGRPTSSSARRTPTPGRCSPAGRAWTGARRRLPVIDDFMRRRQPRRRQASASRAAVADGDAIVLEVRTLRKELPLCATGLFGHSAIRGGGATCRFTLRSGKTLGVVGESGSGKTTHRPDADAAASTPTGGEVLFDGRRPAAS